MSITNAERFLNAYASIEKSLSRILKETNFSSFSRMIQEASGINPIVRNHLENLREYGQLRNAIVHDQNFRQVAIAEPNDYVTEDIERIADLLTRDQNVMTYASSPVLVANVEDTITELYRKMNERNVDKLPVYDGKFIGLVTMREIAGWGLNHSGNEGKARQLLEMNPPVRSVFISRNKTIYDVVNIFDKAYQNGNKVPVILITETGSDDEKPIGILSSYDLTRILSALS